MDISTVNKIDELVTTIQDTFHIVTPVGDMGYVVHVLGGSIWEVYSVSGSELEKTGNYFRIIMGKYDYSSYKDRFSVAVELGQLFLHMGYKIDYDRWGSIPDGRYVRVWNSEEHALAYEFASSFLMPIGLFPYRVRKEVHNGVADITKLSKYFQVSELSVINRMKTLGISMYY